MLQIVNTKGLSDIENPRLQRLKEELIPYSFTLRWKKGSEHAIPDALSRAPVGKATEEDEIAERDLEDHIHAVITANIKAVFEDEGKEHFQDALLDEIHKCSADDPEYVLLKNVITSGFPFNQSELEPILRPYAKMKDFLCVDQDMIVCGQRLVIPRKLRGEVLKRLHSSHQGIEKTRRRARQSVYWPGIDNDITNIVNSCKECQQLLPSLQKETMKSDEEPVRPFESVSADYFDHAGKQFLIYTDRLSGWPMVKMFNTEATAVKLISTLREFFAATGIPEVFRSDNGPQFTAHGFRKFLHDWAVRIHPSSPFYPQSNGHAEASVKAVKHLIIKCTENGNLDTDKFCAALLELRNYPRSDGESPAQVLFGRPIRSVIPVHRRSYAKEWQRSETKCREEREIIKKKAEWRYNQSAKSLPEFAVGTKVNLQDNRTGRWNITGTIVDVGRNRAYLVKKEDGRSVWRNRRFIRKQYSTISLPSSSPQPVGAITPSLSHHTSPRPHVSEANQPPHSPQKMKEPYARLSKSPPRYPAFVMPKIDNRKIPVIPFSLPKKYFSKLPKSPSSASESKVKSPGTSRTRQPPCFLQVDPTKKTY